MCIDVIVSTGLTDNRQISPLRFSPKNGRRISVTVVRRSSIKLESKPKWRDIVEKCKLSFLDQRLKVRSPASVKAF